MNTKFRRFLRKTEVFFKKNALAVIVCATTILTIGVVSLSAYYSLSNPTDTQVQQPEVNVPVSSSEPVVFVKPLAEVKISKDFADSSLLEDKTTGIWQTHQAIDFSATEGEAVFAVYAGTIEKIENSMMEGTIITLKINDSLKVVYKSLSSNVQVTDGDKVSAGQQIATVATNVTEKAEGVHLHLEVYENGKLVNPNNYFSFSDK